VLASARHLALDKASPTPQSSSFFFFFFQIIGQLQHIEGFADGGAIQFQQ